ncbi:hypothetical protein BASA81_001366 [Batrachochytrium salamandrivorans]|nr:hypothetical protein BASA81_001366 [Batrachochytrium salamandrivorans]
MPAASSTVGGAPHVVILGCGYAGGLLAHNLDQAAKAGKIRLTVIDRRSTMHHKIGSIRASVLGGEWASRIEIPLSKITKYSKCVTGEVEQVDAANNTIVFKDHALPPLQYDVLVCATGTLNHSPGDIPDDVVTPEQITKYFAELAKVFNEANDVLIVGGGASAVEYAGEIRHRFPQKKITMICSGANLLTSSVAPVSSGFMKSLYKRLEQLNIELIREEKVVKPSELIFSSASSKFQRNVTVHTTGKKNLTITTDLLLWAATWTKDGNLYPPTWLNEIGEININSETFQVMERSNVFAIGDVSSLSETKQAVTLPGKMKLLSHNVLVVAAATLGKTKSALDSAPFKRYRITDQAVMYLPVGPYSGVSYYKGFVFGDRKTSRWKGRDLYTQMFWGLLTGEKCAAAPKI